MKLILFSASVLYLLGLKLTTQIQVTPQLLHKQATIESKSFQEEKTKPVAPELKIEKSAKGSTVSTGKTSISPCDQHKSTKVTTTRKGAV